MSKFLKVLAVVAIVALAGCGVWWVLFRETASISESPPEPSLTAVETQTARTVVSPVFHGPESRVFASNIAASSASANATNLLTDWEDRVDEILGDDSDVEEKGRKMLELLPRFPEAGQVETAQHISNLLADEDYENFGKFLTNPKTPASVQEVVLMDVLNRPNEIKMPLLLETARNADNAKAQEAREMLELYLEEDYGTDWEKWEQEIKKWLEENPD